jgi:hypothetical protein
LVPFAFVSCALVSWSPGVGGEGGGDFWKLSLLKDLFSLGIGLPMNIGA